MHSIARGQKPQEEMLQRFLFKEQYRRKSYCNRLGTVQTAKTMYENIHKAQQCSKLDTV